MADVKTMVCLANSRKLSGRCIAGRELVDGKVGKWIRPVSARASEEVSEEERRYEDGSDPCVRDIIDVPLLGPRPTGCQQENWLLDPELYWEKRDQIAWGKLSDLLDPPSHLWTNGSSTRVGLNDRIGEAAASKLGDSLRFIHLTELNLSVFAPGEAFGNNKRRVQAQFTHNGEEYKLWVTDPVYERKYQKMPNGDYKIGECFATVSIGEPFRGNCYKLIAAIIEND